jgi:hypothetical protein
VEPTRRALTDLSLPPSANRSEDPAARPMPGLAPDRGTTARAAPREPARIDLPPPEVRGDLPPASSFVAPAGRDPGRSVSPDRARRSAKPVPPPRAAPTPVMLTPSIASASEPSEASASRPSSASATPSSRAPKHHQVRKRTAPDPRRLGASQAAKSPEIPREPPPFAWEAPRSPPTRDERVYEESAARRPPPRRANVLKQATEEQVFEVLRTLVTRSPEARRLMQDVVKEIEALKRLDNLRKF